MFDTAIVVKGSGSGPLTGVATGKKVPEEAPGLGSYGLIPGGNLTSTVVVTVITKITPDDDPP